MREVGKECEQIMLRMRCKRHVSLGRIITRYLYSEYGFCMFRLAYGMFHEQCLYLLFFSGSEREPSIVGCFPELVILFSPAQVLVVLAAIL